MSLTAVLLAFLPAIVRPKPGPEKSDRERELEGRVRELEEELDYVRLERDSARRRLDGAWDAMARLARERIGEWLEQAPPPGFGRMSAPEVDRMSQLAMQQVQAAAQYQGLANPLQQAAYQQMQAMNQQNFARLAGELIDCTGGGRAGHLAGTLGAIGGA